MLQCADTTDILKRKRKISRSIFFYVYFVIINAITCHLAIMEPTSRRTHSYICIFWGIPATFAVINWMDFICVYLSGRRGSWRTRRCALRHYIVITIRPKIHIRHINIILIAVLLPCMMVIKQENYIARKRYVAERWCLPMMMIAIEVDALAGAQRVRRDSVRWVDVIIWNWIEQILCVCMQ